MKIQIKDIYYIDPECYIKRGDIYVSGAIIAGVGVKPNGFIPDRIISGKNKLLMPGLINCHTHAYMSLFRNLADDIPFDDWLRGTIAPLEQRLTPESGYWGAMLSCIEMVKSGTTAFADMHMVRHSSARAAAECGMRAVIARGLEGCGSSDGKRIREAFEEYSYWSKNDKITFMLGPNTAELCDEAYLDNILSVSEQLKLGIHIHLGETAGENERMQKLTGKSAARYLADKGVFNRRTIAAGCARLYEEDMDILAEYGVNAALTPSSAMKSGNGFANAPLMSERGVHIGLGTDGAAGNNQQNMFSEMRMLALASKAFSHNAAAMSAFDVFTAATMGGARALGLTRSGRISAGMAADLVIVDIDRPQFYPHNNLIAALVYSANGSEVETVIVGGEIILDCGHMVKVDEERVYREVELAAKALRK